MAIAIRAGAPTADAVALEARKAAETDSIISTQPFTAADSSSSGATVTFLTERRLAQTRARVNGQHPASD
ncbi:hypothetical protein [Streptosporangium sp. NPDC000396]|uniref:hypothetical protein n=1 Tax=Streptosporangium sp. NPDC000396 TaxID=3366185 RepID=UPI0036C89E56